MSKAKKTFTRLCLNNWGGINHQILEFHEYVNLFSGKSGSGKSTVMDAIQVILYGSFSSSFLNKAADDAKNRRSVLSYLRGEQKDGSANRADKEFCSTIVLEVEDQGTHIIQCVGLAFEVRKTDSDLRRFIYFSHSGKIPEGGYVNRDGIPFTIKEIKKLIEERAMSEDNRGKFDINRTYVTKESYLNVLNDAIMGYVDGSRFTTMEKSAIALRMTNGTGQFIRDYMFPKSTGETIQKISEQLGAYQEIKNQIEDLKNRMEGLTKIRDHGRNILDYEIDQMRGQKTIQCLEIQQTKLKIQAKSEEMEAYQLKIEELEKVGATLRGKREELETELIRVSADLKASDLGAKLQSLEELDKRGEMLANDYSQWKHILHGLRQWEEDEIITEYVSNPMLNQIADFFEGNITVQSCDVLRNRILTTKENIESEQEEHNEQRREIWKLLTEKKKLVEDITNNRKPYGEHVGKAKTALSQKLSTIYGRSIPVSVFADLFDVEQEEWKDALEGRLGRLKTSLITEPQYAQEAVAIFRKMKEFENVELIHSKAILERGPVAKEHSLYEAVRTDIGYIDTCLKRYLGSVIKCESIAELEAVRDGVTKDCYAYSNDIFRHLKQKDYTTYACIGTKVSKAKLKEYESELASLEKEHHEVSQMVEALKLARGFEELNQDGKYLVQLSKSGAELEKVALAKGKLQGELQELREGTLRLLEEQETALKVARGGIEQDITVNQTGILQTTHKKLQLENDITTNMRDLEKYLIGYVADEELEQWARAEGSKQYATIKSQQIEQITRLEGTIQKEREALQTARNQYIIQYPNCGFNGAEKSNEKYDTQLAAYTNDYEEKYLEEFTKQAKLVHQSLRDNVLATIHGDIKAAKRHTHEINRLLRDTNFSDSTYQIKIEAAKDENGQFYDMLMAEELDSKNIHNDGFQGQLSFGEETFYQKYEQKIQLLLEKFMPPTKDDHLALEQRQKEMERYSDYRNYLSFSMFEQVTDETGRVIRENFVDDMAGKDSGGEGQNPKYVALLAGFAMLYMQQTNRDSKIKLVLLDEAFSKMDQERSAVCLKYARKMELQLIVCVPDERLQSLVRNVDSVYGFRRHKNQIQMMHINKGDYLSQIEGDFHEKEIPSG